MRQLSADLLFTLLLYSLRSRSTSTTTAPPLLCLMRVRGPRYPVIAAILNGSLHVTNTECDSHHIYTLNSGLPMDTRLDGPHRKTLGGKGLEGNKGNRGKGVWISCKAMFCNPVLFFNLLYLHFFLSFYLKSIRGNRSAYIWWIMGEIPSDCQEIDELRSRNLRFVRIAVSETEGTANSTVAPHCRY